MNRPHKPLTGYRKVLVIQAENLRFQFNIAQDAYSRNALNCDYLEGLIGAAKLLDDTAHAVCSAVFGVNHIAPDYCPKIDKPTFDEIAHRFNCIDAQLSKIAESDQACTRLWLFELLRRSAFLLGAVDWLADEFEPAELGANLMIEAKSDTLADFSHRLSPFGLERGTLGVMDTVNCSVNKAVAVVTMLSNAFAADNDEDRPSNDSVYYALQSIQHELLDVGAIVEAFHNHHRKEASA